MPNDIARYSIPGSGVLLSQNDNTLQRMVDTLQKHRNNGVDVVVTDHENCGANAFAAKKIGSNISPDLLGRCAAEELAMQIGIPPDQVQRMGYNNADIPMLEHPHFHPTRVMLVDLDNSAYNPSALGIESMMKLNRYTDQPDLLTSDIGLLLSIMMDKHHAAGYQKFQKDHFMVTIVGDQAEQSEFHWLAFKDRLTHYLAKNAPYLEAIDIVGFSAPERSNDARNGNRTV